ncbi:testican-2-like isoform X2 [Sinocyclocheilus anshuiensis]|uniref:testican-2-like isoform X2 n=1 Tax=Sinocyclocheilus anshuiensis TaxID=1608454 RepID=UPI0007B985AF|nr:PREDICTED: testican-2-like isoform X2 [Sinocyclocheilus anshuiensis]
MVWMNDLGCLLVPLLMLARVSVQVDVKSGKEPEKTENFMEDEQWLSTISQYSRKIKHWNRFRDDDYIRSWDESQGSNENVDTTKDPCQKVKCSRNKVCVAQGYQRAVCVNRRKLEHRLKQQVIRQQQESNCKPCPVSSSGPVCGSDGHNYASQCKLEQQACLTGKELKVRCAGLCPCTATVAPATDVDSKQESCTGQDLADLGDRLRDWFQLLQGNGKQNSTGNPVASSASIVDRTLVATCKDSIGWMFSKLDTNSDLYLDQAELSAINLDKYEVCIRPFFNSCDSYHDGKVSTAEWCLCFWREKPPCLAELERIQVQEGAKKKSDTYIPSCDEDGFYRRLQCDKSRGECWCVDQRGGELMGSRIHGNPDCDEVVTYSGDFGSGLGWEDEEEEEAEENGEEAEEEEGEVGEVDDGGYIW